MYAHTGELPRLHTIEVRVRSFALAAIAVVLMGVIALAFTDEPAPAPTNTVLSIGHRPSHERRYFAEVVAMTPGASIGMQTWEVRLTRRNHRRLTSADVTARVWMPATGETSATGITGQYVGDGRYRFTGLPLTKAGWWNIDLVVDGKSGRDSVAFNVILP